MSNSKSNMTDFKPDPDKMVIREEWVMGSYLVTGVFPMECKTLTIEEIRTHTPVLFKTARSAKKGIWWRPMAGYYLIPIYCGQHFTQPVIDWVHNRPNYKWAIWHEPILYNIQNNSVELFNKRDAYGMAFRRFLFQVMGHNLVLLARKYGLTTPPAVVDPDLEKRVRSLWK